MSRETGLLRVASHGLSRLSLKSFPAFFADLTDRPWVSNDRWRPTELSLIVFSFNNCTWPLDKLSHLPDFFRENGYFALLFFFFSTKADRRF